MKKPVTPLVILILDGFGYSKNYKHNAISFAKKPTLNYLFQNYPNTLISSSGSAIGLPVNQMGNSEVGHMTIGSGRIVYQGLTRITESINRGDFFKNSTLCKALKKTSDNNKSVHIMGLLSPGGVHSHECHIKAIVRLAYESGVKHIYLHAFLDGRDTPPKSALTSVRLLETFLKSLGRGRIVSLIGRYYAMDRDNRWEKTAEAYNLILDGKGRYYAENAEAGINNAYAREETDEFISATSIGQSVSISDGDLLIFMNFRSDRARQLTNAFVSDNFRGFFRTRIPNLTGFVMLTNYGTDIPALTAFPPLILKNVLGECLEREGKSQLRIAETEKYAHITFFLSGGKEEEFRGEERILVDSERVATYDLKPEMSAYKITQHVVKSIRNATHDVIIVNYANTDMVGHTGVFSAAIKSVECVDICLKEIIETLKKIGGEALITADHGNIEQMWNEKEGQVHTAHTCNPVPFIYFGKRKLRIREGALSIADIAPTVIYLLDLEKPREMTGTSILESEKIRG